MSICNLKSPPPLASSPVRRPLSSLQSAVSPFFRRPGIPATLIVPSISAHFPFSLFPYALSYRPVDRNAVRRRLRPPQEKAGEFPDERFQRPVAPTAWPKKRPRPVTRRERQERQATKKSSRRRTGRPRRSSPTFSGRCWRSFKRSWKGKTCSAAAAPGMNAPLRRLGPFGSRKSKQVGCGPSSG